MLMLTIFQEEGPGPTEWRPLIQLQNTGNEDAIMVLGNFMLGHNPEFSNITVTNISENFIDLSGLCIFQDVQPYLTRSIFLYPTSVLWILTPFEGGIYTALSG